MTNVGSEPIMLRPISPRSNTWLIIWSERRPASTHSASDARPPLGMTTSLRASSQRDFFTRFPWAAAANQPVATLRFNGFGIGGLGAGPSNHIDHSCAAPRRGFRQARPRGSAVAMDLLHEPASPD